MITSDVIGALRRRWHLVLLGLVVTGGMLWATVSMVPVTYESKAMVVLLPPRNLENIGGNPYLALGGLDSVAGVLSRSMSTDKVADQVHDVAPGATYLVEPDATTSGPVLLITTEADSPAHSLAGTEQLVKLAPLQMKALQQSTGVVDDSFITTSIVTQDDVAVAQHKAQIRALLAIGVGSLTATVLGVAMIDGLLLRRRERRRLRVVDDVDDNRDPPNQSNSDDERTRRPGGGGGPRGGNAANDGVGDGADEGPVAQPGLSKSRRRGRGVARQIGHAGRPTRIEVPEGSAG